MCHGPSCLWETAVHRHLLPRLIQKYTYILCLLTINHLLIEYAYFNDVRRGFYQVPSLPDHFKTAKPEVILDFLKAVRCTGFHEELVIA